MDCHCTAEWIFLTAREANMDGALCNARPVHNVQRHLEELEQRTLALEQGPRGFEEPSISDSGVITVMDSGENEGARLFADVLLEPVCIAGGTQRSLHSPNESELETGPGYIVQGEIGGNKSKNQESGLYKNLSVALQIHPYIPVFQNF
ncbi:hypothetical protein MJT46_012195 [Ovis ammon polii x Ovis aries]|nr:hypothetical protein MJT46_012195 [Ovis ammon polii x Ovis aries]